ncbi:CNNM [Theobroma cacao]|nr:CNNM [Theobroma cacao]
MAANDVPCCESMFWVYLVICVALVSFAGLMSGLTLGLMSLSLVDLEVVIKAGQPQDRRNAEKILPIVKNQHLLLCTLLIGNAMAMEALPIFLDSLLSEWCAILISVTLILAFGEIIPQAVCSRYGLSVGAKLSVLVRFIVIILFPVAYPISKLLDLLLGKRHSALLRRAELKTLVDMHGNEAGKGGELTHDETTIISGALDMTQKTAKDAMTPLSNIFSLDINSKLDEKTMGIIISKGHSRVPIYSGSPANIIGLILVKNLIKCRPEDETPIRDLTIRSIPRVHDCFPLYDILNQFQEGHSHMAVVVKCKSDYINEVAESAKAKSSIPERKIHSKSKKRKTEAKGIGQHQYCRNEQLSIPSSSPSANSTIIDIQSPTLSMEVGSKLRPQMKKREQATLSNRDLESFPINLDEEVLGIITLEDVMEELLQEEIFDETDDYVDVHTKITINMQPSRRSPLRSPRAATASHLHWRSPTASPISSCHGSPLSSKPHSPAPVAPYVQSPLSKPTLCAYPRKPIPNSPSKVSGAAQYSPSPHQVSRKSYERLRPGS